MRKLLKNADFRKNFISRYSELSKSYFSLDYLIAKIDSFENVYKTLMPEQINRWGYPHSMEYWKVQVESLREFARQRPKYFEQHLNDYFEKYSNNQLPSQKTN